MRNYFLGLIAISVSIFFIMNSFTNSIVGKIEGMICIECQEKLIEAFKEELGTDTDIEILISWEDGVGILSFPKNKSIDEAKFTQIVQNAGFEISDIKIKGKHIKDITEAKKIFNEQ